MAGLALDDNDMRKAVIRQWMWTYLGRGPSSVDEQNYHVYLLTTEGADLRLAAIADSPEAAAFRAKRGW